MSKYSLRREIQYFVANRRSKQQGVKPLNSDRSIVVTLTTTKDRVKKTYLCLESLLNQTMKPNKIVLWLEEQEFGENWSDAKRSLPPSLLRTEARGIEFRFTQDIGSYVKLLPALRAFPNDILVTADDDTMYPPTWVKKIFDAHKKAPQQIICYRGWHIKLDNEGRLKPYDSWPEYNSFDPSFALFPTGKDGVLYPPGSLNNEIFNTDAAKKLSPTNDDVWFKAMSLLNQTRCIKITKNHRNFPIIRGTAASGLQKINVDQAMNDIYLKNVFEQYGLYEIIGNSSDVW